MAGRIRDNVIFEEIEGEVVAIDLASGVYFNLRGSAVDCWQALAAGMETRQVVDLFYDRFEIDADTAASTVAQVIDQLAESGLLNEVDAAAQGTSLDAVVETSEIRRPATDRRRAFVAPTVDRYDEMQTVMGMDPIHEVDVEEGWPKQA
jgi:hypothetical protein